MALSGLRQDQIREKVQAYFKAQLDQYLDWLDRRGLSENALADAREEMLDHESFMDIDSAHPIWLPVQRFKNKMDISDAEWDASQPRIATELRKGRRDMLRRVLEAAERLDRYSYSDDAEPHVSPSVPALPASSPLGQAVDDFIAEQSRTWTTRTTKQFKAYLNILTEFFGRERLLATITKQDANDVKKLLLNLPSSRNTIPALKGLPLLEVVKVTGRKTIAPKTINSHIQMFHSFFKWAERHGHSPHILFEGMKVAKAKNADTEVKPYTPEQTQLIYTELTENTSGLIRSESHKWASLIGMFTGARQNEICQLHISDVQNKNGICFLNLTDEGDNGKSIKTSAGRRKVPLHSELIRLGILDFIESRRSKGERLFPDYPKTSLGYGRNLGRWYNEQFLPKLRIKKPGIVFHSLRHTMITRLGQADVPEPIYQCVVGHARAGVTQQVYLKEGFTLGQLKEAIERFKV